MQPTIWHFPEKPNYPQWEPDPWPPKAPYPGAYPDDGIRRPYRRLPEYDLPRPWIGHRPNALYFPGAHDFRPAD